MLFLGFICIPSLSFVPLIIPNEKALSMYPLYSGDISLSSAKRVFSIIRSYIKNPRVVIIDEQTEGLGLEDVDLIKNAISMLINDTKITKKAVVEECKVIEQEIARSNDKFYIKAQQANDYNLYNEKAYNDSVLGSKETINKIEPKHIKAFLKKYFIKNNAFIRVASPLSFSKVKKMVENDLLNNLREDNKFKPLPLYYGNVVQDNFLKLEKQDIKKCYIAINFVFILSKVKFVTAGAS